MLSSSQNASSPTALFRCGVLLIFGYSAWWTARLAWADHLSSSPSLEDRRHAVRLAPLDAAFYGRLAEKLPETSADPLPALRSAAALDPQNPQWRMALGEQAELAGDFPLAEQSLLAAARLSRLYQPKYLLAGYYFRRGNADLCLRWSEAALASAPGDVTPILHLLGRLLDPPVLAADGLRQPAPVARQFLAFLAQEGHSAAAMPLVRRLAQTATDQDLGAILGFTNQILSEARSSEAVDLWNSLCRRRLVPDSPLDVSAGRSLTNPDFQHAPLGAGFDWHAEGGCGRTALRFNGALHASFPGDQTDGCVVLWQYVPLESGVRYRLRQNVQADGAASAAGLRWRLFCPDGRAVWQPVEADLTQGFQAPASIGRLTLIYARLSGTSRLSGEVTLSGLRLDRLP